MRRWAAGDICVVVFLFCFVLFCFFFNDTATTEIYTLSLHDALPILDMVRMRANNPFPEDQPNMPSTTQTGSLPPVLDLMQQNSWSMMDAIIHERYVELFGEQKRWFDIRRWDIGNEVLSYKPGWRGEASYFLPIPQDELDNNPNFNTGNLANN